MSIYPTYYLESWDVMQNRWHRCHIEPQYKTRIRYQELENEFAMLVEQAKTSSVSHKVAYRIVREDGTVMSEYIKQPITPTPAPYR